MTKTTLGRRGAIAALTAIVMIPVIGFAGLAVDLSRIWLLSARLKTAVDAASLVAARTMTSTTRDVDTRRLFWANFNQNGWSRTYLGSTVPATPVQPVIAQESETRIRVTAEATIPTTLFSIISRQTMLVRETTLAEREGSGLELAIVLDQTSSMRNAASGFASKLAAAQSAVATLLTTLYGTSDTKRNLWVSVVPFARTINVGPANTNFLNTTGMPAGWSTANWSGCVEARRSGNDITDISPATAAGRFPPYFDRSTYRNVGWATVGSGLTAPTLAIIQRSTANTNAWVAATGVQPYDGAAQCSTTDAYTALNVSMTNASNALTTYTVAFCRGDNDWMNPSTLAFHPLTRTTANLATYNPEFAVLTTPGGLSGVGYLPTSAAGPNRLCAMNSILPLTASRATIQAAVDAITAPVRSGGTTTTVGMQGAWYTLSPNWQNWWPNSASGGAMGALPLAYNTRNMNKAVIILTDGDNNWQCAYETQPSSQSSPCDTTPVRSANRRVETLYNAYGRAADWNTTFPSNQITTVSQTNLDAALDGRFSAVCAAMKASVSTNPANHRIRIYVVGFEIANNTHRTLLQNCASRSTAPYYFEAPTAADLQGAFSQIADALTSLRMVE